PGRHKCRELWPSDVAEKGFNLYLDSVLLVLPLLIMVFVYALITRTLCAGIRMEHRSMALGIPMKAVYREKTNGFQCTAAQPMVQTETGNKLTNGFRRGTVLVRGGNPEKNQSAMVRVIRMLFVVVIEFFVCWTPLYVVNTWSLYDPRSVYDVLGPTGVSVVQLLAYASSCSNPITYCFMHHKFREGFLAAVGCRKGCGLGEARAMWKCSSKANFASGVSMTSNYQESQKKAQKDPDADSTTVQTPCKEGAEESSD
ncbi:unnamed protein product, partial [Ixodes hexagonus]